MLFVSDPLQPVRGKAYIARMEKGTVELIKKLTPTMLHVNVRPKNLFPFKAGQYAAIQTLEGEETKKKYYSIASSDKNTDSLDFFIRLFSDSPTTRYFESLKTGEEIHFEGPGGKVHYNTNCSGRSVFLCTGSAISQHYSILSSNILEMNSPFLLWGLRNQDEIFLVDELNQLKEKNPSFNYEIVLSAPQKNWSGKTGYVSDHILKLGLKPTDCVYLCGQSKFIENVEISLTKSCGNCDNVIKESY